MSEEGKLPRPGTNESLDQFMARCVLDEEIIDRYDEDNVQSVCEFIFEATKEVRQALNEGEE